VSRPKISTLTPRRLEELLAVSLLALVVVLGGCGGGDDDAAPAANTGSTATKMAEQERLPFELVGTYEAKRSGEDFPSGLWKLAIGPVGEFFNVPPGETGFFNSPLTVDGDTLIVPPHFESGCTEPGEYRYTVEGDGPGGSLTLEAIDDACETRSALLSASWKRTG